jgi:hypothetical protein
MKQTQWMILLVKRVTWNLTRVRPIAYRSSAGHLLPSIAVAAKKVAPPIASRKVCAQENHMAID